MWTYLNHVNRAFLSSGYIGAFSPFISLSLSPTSKILAEFLRFLRDSVSLNFLPLVCLLSKSIAMICWVQLGFDRWICTSSLSSHLELNLFSFSSHLVPSRKWQQYTTMKLWNSNSNITARVNEVQHSYPRRMEVEEVIRRAHPHSAHPK